MTEAEKSHFIGIIRSLWVEDGMPNYWDLDTGDYRALVKDRILIWFSVLKKNGWDKVKVDKEISLSP